MKNWDSFEEMFAHLNNSRIRLYKQELEIKCIIDVCNSDQSLRIAQFGDFCY